MKNFFITNPAAGLGEANSELIHKIETYPDCTVYTSRSPGDSRRIAAEICAAHQGEKIRIFACGGDGTLNEVVNGIADFDRVEVGCMSFGKGNDFVRNFGAVANFRNIEHLLKGKSRKIDLIRYEAFLAGGISAGYIVNMLNIGLDSNAVYRVSQLKKNSVLKGKMPYIVAALTSLIQKDGENLSVQIEDAPFYAGEIILMTAANGSYCGGGAKGAPKASPEDGQIDINVVKDISRRKIFGLIPGYIKGTHYEKKQSQGVILHAKAKEALIRAHHPRFRICIDGEISYAEKIKLKISRDILSFVLPYS